MAERADDTTTPVYGLREQAAACAVPCDEREGAICLGCAAAYEEPDGEDHE